MKITAAQFSAYLRFRNDCTTKNQANFRRWRRERRALRESNVRNLTLVIR